MAEKKRPTTKKSVVSTKAAKQPRGETPRKKRTNKPAKPAVVRQTHNLDATGQILGRLASQISILLRGKHKPTFVRHLDQGDVVLVKNASQLKISSAKMVQKVYYHYTGYPGGLKKEKLASLWAKNPSQALRRAVWNMLPKNKLRDQMIKRLKITN